MRTETANPTAWAAIDPGETDEDGSSSPILDEHDEVRSL